MTRDLFNKTGDELRVLFEQHRDDVEQLRLIRKELVNRKALPARNLAARVDARLHELARNGGTVPLSPAPAPTRRHVSMAALNQRIADNWHDPERLEQLLLPLTDHPDQALAEFMAAKVGARVEQLAQDKAMGKAESGPRPTTRHAQPTLAAMNSASA